MTTLNPLPGTRILDVAGGTGDIAFRCLDRMKSTSTFFSKGAPGTTLPPHVVRVPCAAHHHHGRLWRWHRTNPGTGQRASSSVTVCDINPSMLAVGKERGIARGYTESTGTGPMSVRRTDVWHCGRSRV